LAVLLSGARGAPAVVLMLLCSMYSD